MTRLLSDADRKRLPAYVDQEVLIELLEALPPNAHRQLIDVLIDPQTFLGTNAEMFASRLGSDDPRLAEILLRLYREPR